MTRLLAALLLIPVLARADDVPVPKGCQFAKWGDWTCVSEIAAMPIPHWDRLDEPNYHLAESILRARLILLVRHEGYAAGQGSNGAPDPFPPPPLSRPDDFHRAGKGAQP